MDKKQFAIGLFMLSATAVQEFAQGVYGLYITLNEEGTIPEEMVAELDAILDGEEVYFTPDEEWDEEE